MILARQSNSLRAKATMEKIPRRMVELLGTHREDEPGMNFQNL